MHLATSNLDQIAAAGGLRKWPLLVEQSLGLELSGTRTRGLGQEDMQEDALETASVFKRAAAPQVRVEELMDETAESLSGPKGME